MNKKHTQGEWQVILGYGRDGRRITIVCEEEATEICTLEEEAGYPDEAYANAIRIVDLHNEARRRESAAAQFDADMKAALGAYRGQ